MKRRILSVLSLTGLLAALCACTAGPVLPAQSQVPPQSGPAVVEPDAPTQTPAPAPQTPQAEPTPAPTPQTPTPAPSTSADRLTREQAQAIALSHVGLTASDVRGLRVEYDVDDGVPVYEVEFHAGGFEYDYEIHALTGAILKSQKERDD